MSVVTLLTFRIIFFISFKKQCSASLAYALSNAADDLCLLYYVRAFSKSVSHSLCAVCGTRLFREVWTWRLRPIREAGMRSRNCLIFWFRSIYIWNCKLIALLSIYIFALRVSMYVCYCIVFHRCTRIHKKTGTQIETLPPIPYAYKNPKALILRSMLKHAFFFCMTAIGWITIWFN